MTRAISTGIWCAVIAAVLWSTGGIGIKAAAFDGPTTAAFRALFAGLVFLPFVRWKSFPRTWLLLVFIVIFALMSGTFVMATKLTTASNAIALQYTSIFWVFLFTEFPRTRRIPAPLIFPLALLFIGIFTFFQEPDTGTNVIGNILALSSGIWFGLVAITIKKLAVDHGVSLVCLANLGAFPLLWAVSGFQLPVEATMTDWSVVIYMGIFQMGAAYWFFNKALHSISALTGSFVTLVEPLLNPIWVWLIIGEIPSMEGILGWCCLMLSLLLYLRAQRNMAVVSAGTD
jgi:drug/metabolite transporter (DMT)-like permease